MKWLSGIWEVVKTLPTWCKFTVVMLSIIMAGGYPFYDRYFDYREAVDMNNKRVIRNTNNLKDYGVKYTDITLHDTDVKTGMRAKSK